MSDVATLHPYDPLFVAHYVASIKGEVAPESLLPSAPVWAEREIARARRGYGRTLEQPRDETGANAISYGLARLLGASQPVYYVPGAPFTRLEARFDRGIGMLLRPPSRLFADAGLEISAARAMPIRLDASSAGMGGAFLPPALMGQFRDRLEHRMEQLARRLAEAELDAPAYVGLLLEAAAYAADRGLGLYEAAGVIVPGERDSEPPGVHFFAPDRKRLDRALRARLEAAARPPREPGLLSRVLARGRGKPILGDNHRDEARPWRGANDVTPPPDPW